MSSTNTDTATMEGRLFRNAMRGCINCGAERSGFSKYCDRCKGLMYRWGHTSGRALECSEYTKERDYTLNLIKQNYEQHEGLQQSVKMVDTWLERGAFPLLANHSAEGVDGRSLFTELAAVYTFHAVNPVARNFMGGWEALYIQLAQRAIAMVPKSKRACWATPPKKRDLGYAFFIYLKPIFMNIASSYGESLRKQATLKTQMEEPFSCV
ncbi:hypothetical protein [Halodesulfovibrio sp.]|jgi:hypothetical protein|uniref:hypothetical protein n=1 Tax=Halodesulfovibrio sp. TaxID=1912772 RepID=UPI0025E4F2B2|nr:hypothetical protein [Halodesulfovibrio sp.]MCT4534791.1 hypothetical protein [Halodesulfovibrio sp.]MCT4627237.1 hypothetical protein [Halodesulfovibrio sp.]